MKEIEIKKYYQKKIKELRKHNKSYFEDSSPKISDKQYEKIEIKNDLNKQKSLLKRFKDLFQ